MNLETFLTILPEELRSQAGQSLVRMSLNQAPVTKEMYKARTLAEWQDPKHPDYLSSLPRWVKYQLTEVQVEEILSVMDRLTEDQYLELLQARPMQVRLVTSLMHGYSMTYSDAVQEVENIP